MEHYGLNFGKLATHILMKGKTMARKLSAYDMESWLDHIWGIIESHEEDNPEHYKENPDEADDTRTAMAWIRQSLGMAGEVDKELGNQINVSWHIDDIKHQDNSLNDEQARTVLAYLKKDHDATIGINWDVISTTIDIVRDRGMI